MSVAYDGRFTFVDLFAGIGGFHAALSTLGGQCVYAAEKDPAAAKVYQKAWKLDDHDGFAFTEDINDDVEPIDDLTTIDELARMAANGGGTISDKIPRDFDVLAAGFPCQAFSKSGHQRGILDETRGTLFYNILRIVAERKPKIVFLENVRNLVGPRHRHTTFTTIITALEGLGYIVSPEPTIISPHRIPPEMGGGPQIRDRVYILAIRADVTSEQLPFPKFEYPPAWNPKTGWSITESLLHDDAPAAITDRWLANLPDQGRASELRGLRGADKQHSIAGADWWMAWESLLNEVVTRRHLWSGSGTAPFPGFPIWFRAADEAWEAQERADADARNLPWKHEFLDKSLRFLADYSEEINASGVLQRILDMPHNSWRKLEWQAGDAISLDECLIQLRPSGVRIKKANYTPALVAINQTPILGEERRRLTPYEAGRLQGFPDNVYKAMLETDQKPAERYKQFGNAVHVGAVTYGLTQFINHHFKGQAPNDPSLRVLWDRARTSPAWKSVEEADHLDF